MGSCVSASAAAERDSGVEAGAACFCGAGCGVTAAGLAGCVVPVAAGGSGEASHAKGFAHAIEGGAGHAIHMPSPSYFPVIAAAGFPVIGYGLLFGVPAVAVGLVITLAGFFGWALEPSAE